MCMYIKRIYFGKDGMVSQRAGGEWIQYAKRGNRNNHAAEMLVSISRQRKTPKSILTNFHLCQIPTSLPTSTYPTNPTSSCLTLGFWLSPDQTPVNNTGQVTPSRLAFIVFFFSFLVTFCSFLPHWVQSFPILLRLHPVHSLSLLKNYKWLGLCSL